jgi:hypothetical protein
MFIATRPRWRSHSWSILVGGAALILTCAAPRACAADIRSGRGAYAGLESRQSSPAHPVLREVQVRYDAEAGRVDATVGLYGALAPPGRALAPWWVRVEFGDWLRDGVCAGGADTTPQLLAGLGDDEPGTYTHFDDQFARNAPQPAPVTKAFAADRASVTLTVTHPRLRGLKLICAKAGVYDSDNDSVCSCTRSFLLDGFSPLDGGAIEREAGRALDAQVGELSRRWDALDWREPRASCAAPAPQQLTCRVSVARVNGLPGRPALTLRGSARFAPERQRAWRWALRGELVWRRCPSRGGAPAALRGRPCRIALRWNGSTGSFAGAPGDLANLVPSPRGLRKARAS